MDTPAGVMAEKITVVDVTPRDGLQNEPKPVSTEKKLELIEKLVRAGVTHIQATSFVHPKWVPQMADAEILAAQLDRFPGICFSALIPNAQGYDRAIRAGLKRLEFVVSATKTFNQRNLNCTIEQSIHSLEQLTARARQDGVAFRVGISTSFHCPFEGWVSSNSLISVVRQIRERVPWRLALCDTDGMAYPRQVEQAFKLLQDELGIDAADLAFHVHDTYGRGLANVLAALQAGCREFDATASGLGGCPYSPGATGNLATEDLVDFLTVMGFDSSIEIEKILDAAEFAHSLSSLRYQGHLLRAKRPLALANMATELPS